MMNEVLITLSLAFAAAGLLVLGGIALAATRTRYRSMRKLDMALSMLNTRMMAGSATLAPAQPIAQRPAHGLREARQIQQQITKVGERWIDTALGHHLVSEEDRKLLEECGYVDEQARALFGGARIVLPLLLAGLALLLAPAAGKALIWVFAGFALGYLAPKWLLARRRESRRRCVEDELPVIVDMLRLLQGVGLSIDQSLQVIASEFQGMLPVLAEEFGRANRQFASGRPREQTLTRIAKLFDSEDLKGLITLLMQVDRFGGAVQEPLQQFSSRLQESRRARLKDRVGKLTVKMTVVMVLTLLPALLIVAGGPGFLNVQRSLQQISGGH